MHGLKRISFYTGTDLAANKDLDSNPPNPNNPNSSYIMVIRVTCENCGERKGKRRNSDRLIAGLGGLLIRPQ